MICIWMNLDWNKSLEYSEVKDAVIKKGQSIPKYAKITDYLVRCLNDKVITCMR